MAALGPTVRLIFAGDSKDLEAKLKSLEAKTSSFGDKLNGITKGLSISALAGSVIPVLGGVVGAVTQLAGAALLVPGAALAGAAAMDTFKLATSGFGDAVGAGLSGNVKKFTEATKDMAPAMRQAVGAVVAMRPQLTGLKKDVQGQFWDGFSSSITELGHTYLPILHTGLTDIASSLGGVTFSALEAAKTPFFSGSVGVILSNTARFLGQLGSAVGDVLTGFVGIGQVGATYLPALGTAINGIADRFAQWVKASIDSGKMFDWIDYALQGFRDLGGIVVNVGSILASVFTGLGGQVSSPLASIRELTGQLAAFMQTAGAQDALAALGGALQSVGALARATLLSALQALVPMVIALAPVVTAVAIALTSWGPALGPILVGLYGLNAGFKVVSAGLGAYNEVMDLAKSKVVVAAATHIASWTMMAAQAMARAVVMAASWVVAMGPIGWAIAAVVGLAALIFLNWDAISAATATAWSAITGWISGAWTVVTAAVSSAISAVVGTVAAMPGQVLGFLMQLPAMAAFALGYLAGLVYLGAIAAWNFLWSPLPGVFEQLGAWLLSLPGLIVGWLVSLGVTLVGVAVSAWQGFAATTISVASSALAWISTVPGTVGAFLASLPGILVGAAVAAWTGFLSSTTSTGSSALAWIGTVPGRIMGFFSNAGSWLVNAGMQIVMGLWNGLKNTAQAVLDWIVNLGRQIAAGFAAAVGIHSPSKVFAEFGVNIGEGLVVGMHDVTPAVVGTASGMASDAAQGAAMVMGSPGLSAAAGPARGAEVRFTGNVDSAFATAFMRLVRTGQIQIS